MQRRLIADAVAAIPLGPALLRGSSHLPADSRGPRCASVAAGASAYLVLLQMEVAAFHVHTGRPVLTRLCGPVRHVTVHGR